jgi:hypothetical protein
MTQKIYIVFSEGEEDPLGYFKTEAGARAFVEEEIKEWGPNQVWFQPVILQD